MSKGLGIGCLMAGFESWLWPTFNGFWVPPADITTGEGRIIGAIFIVGGLILFCMPSR